LCPRPSLAAALLYLALIIAGGSPPPPQELTFRRLWALPAEAVVEEEGLSALDHVLVKFLALLNDRNAGGQLLLEAGEAFWTGPFTSALGSGEGEAAARFLPLRVAEEEAQHEGKCTFLLRALPFLVPFQVRVEMFRAFVALDRARLGLDGAWIAPVTKATIRRSHVFADGFAQLSHLHGALKSRIAITFTDAFGEAEAGVDGGGIFKEFLSSLSSEVFHPEHHFFTTTPDHLFYPAPAWERPSSSSPASATAHAAGGSPASPTRDIPDPEERHLAHLAFVGQMVGKALLESVLLDVEFAPVFLSKWLGKLAFFDDLATFDRDLYGSLQRLKRYTGDFQELCLFFCFEPATSATTNPIPTPIPLIPGGEGVPVERSSVVRYVHLLAHYRLNLAIQRECRAFFNGLSDLIDPKWIRMFSVVGVLCSGALVLGLAQLTYACTCACSSPACAPRCNTAPRTSWRSRSFPSS
jgi:hypothetical protein